MKYAQFYPLDVVNGVGTRCTLFVTGCNHHCRGCYNQSTWNRNRGKLFDQALEDKIIELLQDTEIPRRGLSLSGGDPLYEHNLLDVLKLVERVKSETTKDIWLWSGYTLEQAMSEPMRRKVLDCVDVFIDGRYEETLRDISLPWRGSSNQVVWKKHLGKFEVYDA